MFHRVEREPVVHEATNTNADIFIADLCVCGMWQPQYDALFYILVLNSDAKLYLDHSPITVIKAAEVVKKRKYQEACLDCRASFTSLCVTVNGLLGSEAECFLNCISVAMVEKWEKSFSAMCWACTRLSFVILHEMCMVHI